MIPFLEAALYSCLFLIPVLFLSLFQASLETLGRLKGKEKAQSTSSLSYLFFSNLLTSERTWKSLLFSTCLGKFLYYALFALASFSFLFLKGPFYQKVPIDLFLCYQIFLLVCLVICIDLLSLLFARQRAEKILQLFSFPCCLLITPFLPFLFLYFRAKNTLLQKSDSPEKLPFRLQDKILDYLADSDLNRYLDKTETKLIHTVLSFKERIVREVMVPRIDVFSLPVETTIKEAARLFSIEGYSRIPVYKESVDKIIGVLLYKDVLSVYTKHIENNEPETDLHKSVEQLIKPALYTPETKKIAGLLQEFRNKQIHLAIVVDEYGGTEGIVTIEDILEELVGEIEDEYDTQESKIYFPLSSGGWIVDAKINILTLEEELGVKIPNSPEYDTIGGFIFHRTGSIPTQGWKVHLENVDLEILTSDERSIQKIKITPISAKTKKHS